MIKFVVFGIQRTGTTLVASLLQSHPDIFSLGELFDDKEKISKRGIQTYKLHLKNFFPYINYSSGQSREIIYQYLDEIFFKEDFDAVGFKLMLNQAKLFPPVLYYLKENKFKIICVFRENLLKTCISRLRARRSGIYDSTQQIYDKTKCLEFKMNIPVEALLKELKSVTNQDREQKKIVPNLDLEFTTVTYEKLLESRREEMKKLLTFLGINTKNIELKTPLEKVSPSKLKNSVENYEEIVQAIRNTPYATYLE